MLIAMVARGTSGKIVHNSFWYGLETIIELFVSLGTSIAVARYLGPVKLGYFSAVSFPISVITTASGAGLAQATRKYMTDFVGAGRIGTARSVYDFTYKYQLLGAVSISAIAMVIVLAAMHPGYKLMAAILVLSMVPGLMSWVPAQANLAFEDASKNTISAFGSILASVVVILLTLHYRWDLPGIAAALLAGRVVEVVLRTIPLNRFLRTVPREPLPEELGRRIRRFCLQAIAIQILISIVWDRSELFFLTAFSDPRQIAFYSVSAGLVDKLLIFSKTFAAATGISLMAEAARNRERVASIVFGSFRFLCLVVLPVHIGAAIISKQAITLAYGAQYLPAVWPMMITAALGIPRAFQNLPDTLMRAADRQYDLISCMILTGIVNIAVDFILIPHHGAVGAAIGNGVAQSFGVVLLWSTARKMYEFKIPWRAMGRMSAATAVMGGVVYLLSRAFPPGIALFVCIATAIPVYLIAIRTFHALDPQDYPNLLQLIGDHLPSGMRSPFDAAMRFMVPNHDQAIASPADLMVTDAELDEAEARERSDDL